jgi:hypothetical protein
MTHDLMKSTLDALGFRVTKVRITALVGNTYHARVHYARGGRGRSAEAGGPAAEVDVDARPSGGAPPQSLPMLCVRRVLGPRHRAGASARPPDAFWV